MGSFATNKKWILLQTSDTDVLLIDGDILTFETDSLPLGWILLCVGVFLNASKNYDIYCVKVKIRQLEGVLSKLK